MKKLIAISLLVAASAAQPAFAIESKVPDTTAAQYNFRLSYEDTERAVSDALNQRGAGKNVAAKINGNHKEALYSYDKPIDVEIRGLRFEKNSNQWSASVLFTSEGEVVSALPVSGKFEEMVSVPTLKRGVRGGEVISEDDVEIHEYPVSRTRTGTITDAAQLIGKSPLRIISAGRPVRQEEVAQAAVIKKNAVIQMRYSAAGMQITASGQAMSDGAKGQSIAVRNLSSKKLVYAVVENENEVKVTAGGQEVSQSTGVTGYETN